MELGVIILLCCLQIALVGSFYMLYRNDKVYIFRTEIFWMCYEYEDRHMFDSHDFSYKWFHGKYSYSQMVFSFRPLKLENWYTKEELEKIRN